MTKKEMEKKIAAAKQAYYYGDSPIMSDEEYDKLIEDYGKEPYVGAPILSSIEKIKIKDKPMLSLDKVHSEKEILSFSDGYNLVASIKCDGLSIRLIYENGILVSANTRGNGYEGANVTEHVHYFLNVPLKINKTERFIIDGEAIIFDDDFEDININNQFKNSRNTASGALSLLDMNIVKKRHLSFIAWDVIEGGDSEFYHQNLNKAKELGFTIIPFLLEDKSKLNVKAINHTNNTLLQLASSEGIPCDGVVWRLDDISFGETKGQTSHHFLNAIAWKPENETYKTRLQGIKWSMGRTGVLTPIAIFDPIEIDGSTVTKASLHNVSVMRELLGDCAYVGEPLEIFKANKIIPQVASAGPHYDYGYVISHGGVSANDTIEVCPICWHEIIYKQNSEGVINAYCSNEHCEGKLVNRLEHFCGKKGLNIKGLSKATLTKLLDYGWIESIEDLYSLSEKHREEFYKKDGFGVASVNKILNAIEQSKNVTLDSFISAIGIPLIGQTSAKQLAKEFKTYENFRKAVDNKNYYFFELPSFGYETHNKLKQFDYAEMDKLSQILHIIPFENEENNNQTLKGKTVVITGKLKQFSNRDKLKKEIEKHGGKVGSSISSKTDILINNDATSTSAKNKVAKEKNIPILTEEEFVKKYF